MMSFSLGESLHGSNDSSAMDEWDPISLMDECKEAQCFGFFTILEVKASDFDEPGHLVLRADEVLLGECPEGKFKVPYWSHLYSNSNWILVEPGQRALLSLYSSSNGKEWGGSNLTVGRYRKPLHVAEYRSAIEKWKGLPSANDPNRLRAEFNWLVTLLESPALYREALYDLMPGKFEQVYPLKPDRFSHWIHEIPNESWQRLFAHIGPSDSYSAGYAWQLWFKWKPLAAFGWLKLQPARSDRGWGKLSPLLAAPNSFWRKVSDVLLKEESSAIYYAVDALGTAVLVREKEWKSDGPTVEQAIAELQKTVNGLETPARRARELQTIDGGD